MFRRSFLHIPLFLILLGSLVLTSCRATAPDTSHLRMADPQEMVAQVRTAPTRVLDAYRFAAANPEILAQIPCYCGCGPMGHGSNYDCFWQESGAVEEHALGCGICVDIAQDVMRGLGQDQDLVRIRADIDRDYSRFGPSTDTPPIAGVN